MVTISTTFPVYFLQTEYFQDDIFKDTRLLWEPTMTSAEWLSGVNRIPATVSLRPNNMKLRKYYLAVRKR